MLQAVVQDYQTNMLTFNNLSLFNIKQLCFLKCFMFEWFDLSMRIKKKTILCGKVFVNFSYFLSLHESFSNNIFLFIVISILERSSSQFFFDFNPSIFVGITGLILNLKINFLLERIIRKSSSLRSKLIAIGYIICYRLYHLL